MGKEANALSKIAETCLIYGVHDGGLQEKTQHLAMQKGETVPEIIRIALAHYEETKEYNFFPK